MRVLRRLAPASRVPYAPEQQRLPRDRAAAVTELFDIHYTQLVRMACLLVDDRETAEDVVMDAFTSIYRRWSAIRDHDDAYRYVRSCVLNGARSQLRHRRLVRLHETATRDTPSDLDLAAQGTNRATVMQLLRALPLRGVLVTAPHDIFNLEISPDRSRVIPYYDGGRVEVIDTGTGKASRLAVNGDPVWVDGDTLIVSPPTG